MSAIGVELLDWLETHHGIVSRSQLARFGITDRQIHSLLATKRLVSYVHGAYRLGGAPQTDQQLAALACSVGLDVIVSHTWAGRAWGFRRLGTDQRVHVSIAGQNHRRLPGVVIHRTHRIDAVDIVERSDGIRVTSPPRTVFDLAGMLSDTALESIVEQVIHDGLATIPTLMATGRRLRQRGRNGSARYGRVLGSRPAWLKPVESDLELVVERAIVDAGLPRPLRQHDIRLPGGNQIRVDFYWSPERVVLEIDHVTWHGGKLDLTADKRRDRQLRRLGIDTIRATDEDVRHGLSALLEDLGSILSASPTHVRSAS